MATLVTNLPAYCFPHELNKLDFRAETGEKTMRLTISVAGDEIIDTVLHFTPEGDVIIDDLASLIRDHIISITTIEIEFSKPNGTGMAEVHCLPCHINLHTTAEVFCKKNFLTRSGDSRRVTTRSIVPFTFIPSGDKTIRYRLVALENASIVNHPWMEIPLIAKGLTPIVFDLDVREVLRRHPTVSIPSVLYIEVEVGKRKMKLEPQPHRRGEIEIGFIGTFGQREIALFDHTDTEFSPKREMTTEAGKRRIFQVMKVDTTMAMANLIPDKERGLYIDCIHAFSHWLTDTQRSIVVTDAKMKDNSDADSTATVEIKYQTASIPLESETPRRIFDISFDQSFN